MGHTVFVTAGTELLHGGTTACLPTGNLSLNRTQYMGHTVYVTVGTELLHERTQPFLDGTQYTGHAVFLRASGTEV